MPPDRRLEDDTPEAQRLRLSALVRLSGEAYVLALKFAQSEPDMKDRLAAQAMAGMFHAQKEYFESIE